MTDTPTLDEKIAAVRHVIGVNEARYVYTDPALRAVLADLEAQKAALLAPQTADDEQEARIRLNMDEWVSLHELSPLHQHLVFFRDQLDDARLALTAARAELAQAREEIARLKELETFDAVMVDAARATNDKWVETVKTLTAEIARLKPPPGADAAENACTLIGLWVEERLLGFGFDFALLEKSLTRAIEAAEARGRAQTKEENGLMTPKQACDMIDDPTQHHYWGRAQWYQAAETLRQALAEAQSLPIPADLHSAAVAAVEDFHSKYHASNEGYAWEVEKFERFGLAVRRAAIEEVKQIARDHQAPSVLRALGDLADQPPSVKEDER